MFQAVFFFVVAAAAGEVPCIDISRVVKGCPSDADVAEIGEALRTFGFFNVVNHGISDEIIARFEAAMTRLFELPDTEKAKLARTATNSRGYAANEFTKQTRDLKELYDYGHVPERSRPLDDPANRVMDGYNQVPADDPDFAAAISAYYDACGEVCAKLLGCCARALGLEPTALDDFFRHHTSFLRLNKYPALSAAATRYENVREDLDRVRTDRDDAETRLDELSGLRLGVNRHFDAGALTLLLQDERVKALQTNFNAHRDGPPHWIDVDPVPGGLTVNCGDMLQVLSNDEFKAPEHRVLASNPGHVRYSCPFFYNPSYDAEIRPLLLRNNNNQEGGGGGPLYTPFKYGYFRRRRFEGDFEDEGKPEIQISHFRTDAPLLVGK
ncbi:hypothetical protein CTAYLR_002241 [Chrysophaeum taylorii]|uniref:Fe2OG dioxygenase domain-containing protein n=1 Tax=Chrysophaeum taylorii TaxID=2483200 RepID=A0AAD7XRK0_9STRA|nr:hypothetical protein CTAYLR_002241 [Chrysophaeum taylorii]